MRLLFVSFCLLIGFHSIAQTDKDDSISFEQVEDAQTLQDLFPDQFTQTEDRISYKSSLFIDNEQMLEFRSKNNLINPELKKAILKNKGKQLLLYLDATQHSDKGKIDIDPIAVLIEEK